MTKRIPTTFVIKTCGANHERIVAARKTWLENVSLKFDGASDDVIINDNENERERALGYLGLAARVERFFIETDFDDRWYHFVDDDTYVNVQTQHEFTSKLDLNDPFIHCCAINGVFSQNLGSKEKSKARHFVYHGSAGYIISGKNARLIQKGARVLSRTLRSLDERQMMIETPCDGSKNPTLCQCKFSADDQWIVMAALRAGLQRKQCSDIMQPNWQLNSANKRLKNTPLVYLERMLSGKAITIAALQPKGMIYLHQAMGSTDPVSKAHKLHVVFKDLKAKNKSTNVNAKHFPSKYDVSNR